LPLRALCPGRPDSQAGEEPPLLHDFNKIWGIPLLRAMHKESHGKGRVVRMPSVTVLARTLKGYLVRARVKRPDLYTSDATRKAMTFHDLRATGITWAAVRGDEPLRIKQRAGHSSFSTTELYLREAENLSHGFGNVFPPLPENIAPISPRGDIRFHDRAKNKAIEVAPPGIESEFKSASEPENLARSSGSPPDAVCETQRTSQALGGSSPSFATEPAEPSDAELERAIIGAVTAGVFDVARTLAAQLDDRRRGRVPSNILDLESRKRGR